MFSQFQAKILQIIITIVITTFSHNILAIQVLTENSPPYQYLQDGILEGSATLPVKQILSCAKISAPITLLPWKRAYQTTLSQKNTLLFSLARTPAREQLFVWIAPIFTSTAYLYKLKSRTDIQLNSLQDLNGYSIGVLPDDYKTKYLLSLSNSDRFKIKYFNQRRSQILMLANGRFDLTANDPDTFLKMIEQFDFNPEDFEKLLPLGPTLTLYLAINKNSDAKLINTLQECGKTLKTH
jgi:polar amino acid transport system substrate-binding protein